MDWLRYFDLLGDRIANQRIGDRFQYLLKLGLTQEP